MRLQNDFINETKELFIWNYECWICGKNGWNAGHHILGRISNSPLNFCPIHNNICHIGNGILSTFLMKKKLLQKTYEYLQKNRYSITFEDTEFISNNLKFYEDFL